MASGRVGACAVNEAIDATVVPRGIGDALAAAFPEAQPVWPLRVLGHGFRSVVVATASGVVFRIGKCPEAAAGYAREARLLPRLQRRLPVAVPEPRWHRGPCAAFPNGVIGYPLLAGQPLGDRLPAGADRQRIAADLAAFLVALHRFPVEDAADVALPGPATEQARLVALRDAVLPFLMEALPAAAARHLAEWWDGLLADESLRGYRPALVHGDLWNENILVDPAGTRVTDILDFENAAVSDPARDLATLRHLGPRFATEVLRRYAAAAGGLDARFAHRIQRWWELREFDGLAYALRVDDPVERDDALRKIRNGPLFRSG